MPVVTLIEPFTESIVCGLVGFYGIGGIISPVTFFLLHFIAWFFADFVIMTNMPNNDILISNGIIRTFGIWALRELSAVIIYIKAILSSSSIVCWRGRFYKLIMGGAVEPLLEDERHQLSSNRHGYLKALKDSWVTDLFIYCSRMVFRGDNSNNQLIVQKDIEIY
jgi:hypothetical protein